MPFETTVPGDGTEVCFSDDVAFWYAESADGGVLQGRISGIVCLFGEVRRVAPDRGFSFTMLSVSGYEIVGRASVASESVQPSKAPSPKISLE